MDSADRLNPLDVWFLHLEDSADTLHIGGVLVFEGPAPPFPEISEAIEARLDEIPRYRQVVKRVPLGLNRPVWVDDPHFSIAYHVRHTALPPPGGADELRNLVGRVMGQRLDRHRPLWEDWIVEGLEDGAWAAIFKIHHCMVDGIAGIGLTEAVLDHEGEPPPRPRTFVPRPTPGTTELVGDAIRDHVVTGAELLRGGARALRNPTDALRTVGAAASGALTMLGLGHRMPPSSLSGPIGPHRRYEWAMADLEQIKAIKSRMDCTVNDVVLTLVTRGFHDLLRHRGEPHTTVRALIPVSTRSVGAEDEVDNRVAALFAHLPTTVEDPLERLAAVKAEMDSLKRSGEAVTSAALVAASGLAPSVLLGPAMHATTAVVNEVGQRNVNSVVTNVPGPQHPLYFRGRRLLQWFPYVPIAEAVRVGVAALSYDGQVGFGLTGDYDQAEDLWVMATAIEDAIVELSKAAGL